MAKRSRHASHANHERWLVSYADFITLLFAFFVMLYANSQSSQVRMQQISDAFREALSEGRLTHALSRLLRNQPEAVPAHDPTVMAAIEQDQRPPAQTVELLPSLRQLNETLKKEIASGRLEVRMEKRGLVISLKEATFFPSGGDMVEPSTLPTLEIIALELKKHPNPIRLEGHTDSRPIRTARFRSNWELSAARGISLLEMFSSRFGLDPHRMAIAGFADTAPVADNETEEGRARNRRVDIVVLNEVASQQEPHQAPRAGS
jgi:chemotaxis protein MotB